MNKPLPLIDCVAGQLQALLDEMDFLDPFQSGFRPGFGRRLFWSLCTMTFAGRETGSVTLLILLDLAAAFDTINHGVFLDRLAGLGVGGIALQWFRSFLTDCVQRVVLGDSCSAP